MVRDLNGKEAAQEFAAELRLCDKRGLTEMKAELREKILRRRGRLDIFMQQLKRRFSRWYNRNNDRHGTLWEERYRSVLVEGGEEVLLTMAAYIDLNPVRAGMVEDPADYAHSGFGEASAGGRRARRAREDLAQILDSTGANWRQTRREYSVLLYGPTGARPPLAPPEAAAAVVLEELAGGGRVEPWRALRCRNRSFSEGEVLGTAGFVEAVFEANRSRYGEDRKTGARRMKGGDWGVLRVLRDLQKDVLG